MSRPPENYDLDNGGPTDDARRMANLKQAWDMDADAPLVVVGQLVELEIKNGNRIFLLERLENPVTGRPLRYPGEKSGNQKKSSAFVSGKEARRVMDGANDEEGVQWAIGELELAPESERRKRNNLDECSVRAGSLRLLKELPEDWNILGVGPQGARKIAASARDAIETQIRNSASRA